MKEVLRNLLENIPGLDRIPRWYRYVKLRWYYPVFKDKEALFTDYYKINNWSEGKSVSGRGSTLAYTKNIREQVSVILEEYNIHEVLDAPCGDYNWFRKVHRDPDVTYVGADIVNPLINENRERYQDQQTTFIQLDITSDPLPEADLWICRDCLIHFSNRDIYKAVENYVKSDITYLLTTTYPDINQNKDIPTGSVRPLNLEISPFNFCAPIRYIEDGRDQQTRKTMGLWRRKDLVKEVDF